MRGGDDVFSSRGTSKMQIGIARIVRGSLPAAPSPPAALEPGTANCRRDGTSVIYGRCRLAVALLWVPWAARRPQAHRKMKSFLKVLVCVQTKIGRSKITQY